MYYTAMHLNPTNDICFNFILSYCRIVIFMSNYTAILLRILCMFCLLLSLTMYMIFIYVCSYMLLITAKYERVQFLITVI